MYQRTIKGAPARARLHQELLRNSGLCPQKQHALVERTPSPGCVRDATRQGPRFSRRCRLLVACVCNRRPEHSSRSVQELKPAGRPRSKHAAELVRLFLEAAGRRRNGQHLKTVQLRRGNGVASIQRCPGVSWNYWPGIPATAVRLLMTIPSYVGLLSPQAAAGSSSSASHPTARAAGSRRELL